MTDNRVRAVGSRIRSLRALLGLSQRQLADAVGTSSGYLSDIENGKTNVSADVLVALSSAFPHVSTRWLLTGIGQMSLGKGVAFGNDFAFPEKIAFDVDEEAARFVNAVFIENLRHVEPSRIDAALAFRSVFFVTGYRAYMAAYATARAGGADEGRSRAEAAASCERTTTLGPLLDAAAERHGK